MRKMTEKKEKTETSLSFQDFDQNSFIGKNQIGSGDRIRTYDLVVNSHLLHR